MLRLRGSLPASRAWPLAALSGLIFAACLAAQSPALEVRVLARVGGLDGTGPSTFGRIEALGVAVDGGFYVLDGEFHELRAFAADGSHRWSFGREGEGPGEFVHPVGLTRGPEGHLWVIDPEAQRATVLSDAGELLDTHRLPAGVALSPWPGRFDTRGRLYSYVESADAEYAIELVRYGTDLRPEATLVPPPPPEPQSYFEGRTARGSDLRARIPFTPRLVWRLDLEDCEPVLSPYEQKLGKSGRWTKGRKLAEHRFWSAVDDLECSPQDVAIFNNGRVMLLP